MRPPLDEPPVIVVGSGIAGALAARRLADAGVPVLVVEAGLDPPGAEGAAILADFTLGAEEDARWRWRAEGMPAAWVRVRRPGGRSRMWGGWFSPCPAASFEHDASAGSPWPFAPPSMLRLQHDVAEALRAWGVTVGTGASDGDGTIRARLSAKLGLPVLPRCAATVGERPLHALDLLAGVPLRTGLIATYLALHSGGAVEALVARAREGAERAAVGEGGGHRQGGREGLSGRGTRGGEGHGDTLGSVGAEPDFTSISPPPRRRGRAP